MPLFCDIEKGRKVKQWRVPNTNTEHMFRRADINLTRAIFCPAVDHDQRTGQTCRWPAEQLFCFVLRQHAGVFDLLQGRPGRLQPGHFDDVSTI